MPLPNLTPEQRASALESAARARKVRAEVKANLKHGTTTLPDVLRYAAGDEVLAGTKVVALIRSVPGVGPVKARQIMERLGIADTRRVKGLGPNQRAALMEEFAVT